MDKECAFETTQWTAVMAAADQKATGSIEALQKLCGVYWFPIYAYARSQGAGEGEAEDLTQAFFAHLLDKGLSIRSGRDGGRFRSFLIRCYRNFVTSEWRKENAVRRGGGTELLSFDELDTEVCSITEAEHALTPEELYERKWAQTLLARAVVRLREEYVLVGKEDRFQQMSSGLTSDLDLGAYEAIGAKLGMNVGAVRTAVHRLRSNFARVLREEVGRLVDDPEDVEEELRYVLKLLN